MNILDIMKIGPLPLAIWGTHQVVDEATGNAYEAFTIPLDALWLFVLLCALGGVIAYFLGSMNFAIIISKIKFKEDIRTFGSGNAGMTNMLRTYGKAAAAFTLLGDMLKAAVSVLIGMLLAGESGAYIAGFLCVIGHSFPCYYKFKGGKGIVVTATALLCLQPIVFLILFLFFVIMVATTKYLSLGSIFGMFLYPIILNSLYPLFNRGEPASPVVVITALANALLVIWLHRENIKRLRAGTENKFSLKKKDKFVKGEKKDSDGKEEKQS